MCALDSCSDSIQEDLSFNLLNTKSTEIVNNIRYKEFGKSISSPDEYRICIFANN